MEKKAKKFAIKENGEVHNYEEFSNDVDNLTACLICYDVTRDEGRWEYFKEVIAIIQKYKFESFLELGPGYIPIVKNADAILNPCDDLFGRPNMNYDKIYTFDATKKM